MDARLPPPGENLRPPGPKHRASGLYIVYVTRAWADAITSTLEPDVFDKEGMLRRSPIAVEDVLKKAYHVWFPAGSVLRYYHDVQENAKAAGVAWDWDALAEIIGSLVKDDKGVKEVATVFKKNHGNYIFSGDTRFVLEKGLFIAEKFQLVESWNNLANQGLCRIKDPELKYADNMASTVNFPKLKLEDMIVLFFDIHDLKRESIQQILAMKLKDRGKEYDTYGKAFQNEIKDRAVKELLDKVLLPDYVGVGRHIAQGQRDFIDLDKATRLFGDELKAIQKYELVDEDHKARTFNSTAYKEASAMIYKNSLAAGLGG